MPILRGFGFEPEMGLTIEEAEAVIYRTWPSDSSGTALGWLASQDPTTWRLKPTDSDVKIAAAIADAICRRNDANGWPIDPVFQEAVDAGMGGKVDFTWLLQMFGFRKAPTAPSPGNVEQSDDVSNKTD